MIYRTKGQVNRCCEIESLEPRRLLTATVPPAPLVVAFTDGASFTGTIANFATLTSMQIPNLSAVIHWGDGTKSDGTIQAGTSGLDVLGTHTYNNGGSTVPVKVVVFSTAAGFVPPTVFSVAQITGATFSTHLINETTSPFAGSLGRVSNKPLHGLRPSAFITWGDGTSGAGQVITNSDGSYRVSANHSFANPGLYDVNVLIELSAANGPGLSFVGPKFQTTIYDTVAAAGATGGTGTFHGFGTSSLLSFGASVNAMNSVLK